MKDQPKLYGPEVPGYALLNEALRHGKVIPGTKVKQPRKRTAKSQPDASQPK